MLKRLLSVRILLAGILVVSLLLAGCTQVPSSPEGRTESEKTGDTKKSISIWNCDNSPLYENGIKEIIADFNAKYPDIEVEYTGLPWDNAKEKFDTAIATRTAPDLAYITQQWAGSLAGTGRLVSFNSYADNWEYKDQFDFDLFENGGLTVNGELYMFPFEYGTTLCWYRADWFKENGLDAPENFDEFFNAIEKMTDLSKGRYGFSIRGGSGGSNQLEGYLSAYAGATQYFLDNGECFVTDPKVLEGLKRFVSIYKKYTPESDITNGYAEMVAAFGSDVAAMIYHNNSSYPNHLENLKDPSKFDAFVLPLADNGIRSMLIGPFGYSGWIMFEDSVNRDEAWKFVEFAVLPESQTKWNQTVGGFPTNKIAQDADWIDDYPALVKIREALNEPDAVFNVAPAYYPDYAGIHLNTLTPGFQAVLAGEKTPEEFLAEWNDLMKQAKADYEKSIN